MRKTVLVYVKLRLGIVFLILAKLCYADSNLSENAQVDIDLRDSVGGVLILSDSEGAGAKRRLILPEFGKFCHVSAEGKKFRWIGAANRMFPWVGEGELTSIYKDRKPTPPTIVDPNQRAMMMLFQLNDGQYLSLLPLSGEDSVAWLETQKDGSLLLGFTSEGQAPVPADSTIPLLSWSVGDHVYAAIAQTWQQVIEHPEFQGEVTARVDKTYPEAFEYLGWCTWEQYRKKISESLLMGAIDGIENSGIPIRWMLIDDGHQTDVDYTRMISLTPNIEKFPNGWQPIIDRKTEDKLKWIGIWHTPHMHWNGIDSNHDIAEINPFVMPNLGFKTSLIPKDNLSDSQGFYDVFIGVLDAQGFDFLKSDNISRSLMRYTGTENAVRPHVNNLRSMERSCEALDMPLMLCSAQNTVGMLNTTYSSTMRTSPDYKKKKPESSKSQILQSVFNVSWLGQTLWPDHDMFHSSDENVGSAMAVTKAMSGGPIYLSDAPDDFQSEIILPLCYDDGLLIRPQAPGTPLPDSLFTDALYEDGSVYKVIAPLNNQSCAIAVYNLNLQDNAEASGVIVADDYTRASAMIQPYPGLWTLPDEGLILYDWYAKSGSKLEATGYAFEFEGFGHKLVQLSPIQHGWSVIGRPDKYMSAATVEVLNCSDDTLTFKMHEPAPIVLYSANGTPKSDQVTFEALNDGFYKATFTAEIKSGNTVLLTRESTTVGGLFGKGID